MNRSLGLIGRKLGMTQIFTEDGIVARVTAIEAGPCFVVAKRTVERDGYAAIQLGFGEKPERLIKRPVRGQFRKAGVEPRRYLREIRLTEEVAARFKVGDQVTLADVFKEGDRVDVIGLSKGRGFTGVIKRHHFAGSVGSHGSHEYFRHGGSVGQNMTPGRTFKGLRMPGQHGNRRITVPNVRVVKILPDSHMIFIEGSVPGAKDGIVIVRGARKQATTAS